MILPISNKISLTEYRSTDAPSLVQYLSNEKIYRNTLKIPRPYTLKDAETWLHEVARIVKKNEAQTEFVIRNTAGELMGAMGLMFNHGRYAHKAAIGYWLAEPFWNKGIMTAALQVFTDHCFAQFDLMRIEAYVFNHNAASARVLEKLGFEREGLLRKCNKKENGYIDSYLYAKVR
ncbi:MAG: GNAT family protein [Bacteroidota bacterium]